MNKIITLPIFLLLTSNVFASHINLPNLKLTRSATKQTLLPAGNKLVVGQIPTAAGRSVAKQVLATNNPDVKHRFISPASPRAASKFVAKEPQAGQVSLVASRFVVKRVLSGANMPVVEQIPAVVTSRLVAQKEPQVVLQTTKSANFLELPSNKMVIAQDEIIRVEKLSRSSFTAKKSSGKKSSVGREEGISVLFEEMNDVMVAIKSNDIVTLEKHLSEDDFIFDQITSEERCSVLMYAIKYGDVDMVMLLLQKHKFHLDETDMYGRTALMYAASDKTMLRALVELLRKGASVDKVDDQRRSALMYAASRPANIEIAVVLLNHGADYSKVDDDNLSAFDRAVLKQNVKMIEDLLLRGVSKAQVENALEVIAVEYNKAKEDIQWLDEVIQGQEAIQEQEESQGSDERVQGVNKVIKKREELNYRKKVWKYVYGMLYAHLEE